MYTGIPVCVFSRNPTLLEYAEDWFIESGVLESKTLPHETATNFVLFPVGGWNRQVSWGSAGESPEKVEAWLINSAVYRESRELLGCSDYIFINLDEYDFINLDEEVLDEYSLC